MCIRTINKRIQVCREVAEALAVSVARRREVDVARRRAELAMEAFRLDLERARHLQGRVIEVLDSLNLLIAARQDLIRALVQYDQAQFQLYAAPGQTP